MGINTHYYTVYGVELPYNEGISEKLHDYALDLYKQYELKTSPCNIIGDGMGGEYMVIGKILFDSGDLRYGDIDDVFVKIDVDPIQLQSIRTAALAAFEEHFAEFMSLVDVDWNIYTFAHYS